VKNAAGRWARVRQCAERTGGDPTALVDNRWISCWPFC